MSESQVQSATPLDSEPVAVANSEDRNSNNPTTPSPATGFWKGRSCKYMEHENEFNLRHRYNREYIKIRPARLAPKPEQLLLV